ncbi:MAG: hypothetical protein Q8K40_01295 [Ignavibacteria bacterium]|nr:hypothetical protein [Ignavibacteria bacterium]
MKYTFPKGMLVVGDFICYKDSTRQRRVAKIPKGFNICNKKTKLKEESHRDSMFFNIV